MNSIETMFHKMIPDKYYEVQKHNLVGIFFVVLVILIAQYPAEFRRSFNTVYGKLFILILIMLLTNYNVVAGLTATIVVLALISKNPQWLRVNMPASIGKPFFPGS